MLKVIGSICRAGRASRVCHAGPNFTTDRHDWQDLQDWQDNIQYFSGTKVWSVIGGLT